MKSKVLSLGLVLAALSGAALLLPGTAAADGFRGSDHDRGERRGHRIETPRHDRHHDRYSYGLTGGDRWHYRYGYRHHLHERYRHHRYGWGLYAPFEWRIIIRN